MHWSNVSAADASSRDLTAAEKATFLWVTICCKKKELHEFRIGWMNQIYKANMKKM